MRALIPALLLLAACGSGDAYILEGTVVSKPDAEDIVVDHEAIEGFMPAMTMPFSVKDPAQIADVNPGDKIYARLIVDQDHSWLAKVRVVGHGPVPAAATPAPATGQAAPLQPGERLATVQVPLQTGDTWTLGAGQGRATVLSFIYTRCPLPDFCPATVARMQALQGALLKDGVAKDGPRILLITMDPDYDTAEVLSAYAKKNGADPKVWAFGRVDADALEKLAARAGLPIIRKNGGVLHALRTLVLAPDGTLIERYDDDKWPLDRVLSQLRTGGPAPSTSAVVTQP